MGDDKVIPFLQKENQVLEGISGILLLLLNGSYLVASQECIASKCYYCQLIGHIYVLN